MLKTSAAVCFVPPEIIPNVIANQIVVAVYFALTAKIFNHNSL